MSIVDKVEDGEKCMRYCERASIYTQIQKLKFENHNIFKYVICNEIPWNYKKYGGVPSENFLKNFPTDFDLKFDKLGCEAMSSFCVENVVRSHCQIPLTDMNVTCTSLFNSAVKVKFCQENCFNYNFPLDLYWDNKTKMCQFVNLPKKIFCLKPHEDNKVPPLLWDQQSNKCKMSKEYCEYFGFSYNTKNNECFNPKILSFLEEYVFGKTLIRTMFHPTLVVTHAGDGRRIMYNCQRESEHKSELESEQVSDKILLYDIPKDFAIASIPEIGIYASNASLQYLIHFTRNLDEHLIKSMFLLEANNIVREKLLTNVFQYLTKISKLLINPKLFTVFILGTILDVTDQFDLNKSLTSVNFNDIMEKFDKSFIDQIKFNSVNPELILDLEVLQLKSRSQIEKAFKLKYGGIDQLVRNINIYLGGGDTLVNDRIVIKNQTDTLFLDWPIKGCLLFFEICLISTFSIASLLYSNVYLLIILIILTIFLILHLQFTSKWS